MDLKELGLQKFAHGDQIYNVIAKEGDKGTRGLLIEFEEGLDCTFYAKDREGKIHDTIANEVDGGLYEIIYPKEILKRGIVPAEIKFKKDDEILSTCVFDIKVLGSLFSLRNGITIVDEVNLADEEVIETTVEYYDEFVRVGYPWGRNLLEGSANIARSWESDSHPPYKYLLRVDIISILPKVKLGDELTFSFDVEMERGDVLRIYDSNGHPKISYGSHAFYNIGSGKQRLFFTKTLIEGNRDTSIWYMDFYNNNNEDKFSISNIKLEKGSTATPWTPAPEDLNELKGTQYNLSTTLKKDTYYTMSVEGDFEKDDFVGVWLGTDKFIGYLQDNKITFKVNEQLDDDYIVVKSLKEEGTINSISIKEVEN